MRVALGIEYNGRAYRGWQRQGHVLGVQQVLEEAISKVANQTVEVHCAGRTDAGVHATGQVVHFDSDAQREMYSWKLGVNSNLPPDVAVQWAIPVDDTFHARFSATARRYRYIICNQAQRSAIHPSGLTIVRERLCEKRMHEAVQCLIGEHDFTSFRAKDCQSNSPVRTIHSISVSRFGNYLMLDLCGNAFLHHMVRNIVGSLLMIGKGEMPVNWIQSLLALKDRPKAGPTAKPYGLYLVDVIYPEALNIPSSPLGPLFIPD